VVQNAGEKGRTRRKAVKDSSKGSCVHWRSGQSRPRGFLNETLEWGANRRLFGLPPGGFVEISGPEKKKRGDKQPNKTKKKLLNGFTSLIAKGLKNQLETKRVAL